MRFGESIKIDLLCGMDYNVFMRLCCKREYFGRSFSEMGKINSVKKLTPADHISVKDRGRFYSNESVIV